MEGDHYQAQSVTAPDKSTGGHKRQASNHDEDSSQNTNLHIGKAKRARKSKANKHIYTDDAVFGSDEAEASFEGGLSRRNQNVDSQNALVSLSESMLGVQVTPLLTPLAAMLIKNLADVEDHHKDLDEEDLGRAVRLSPSLRLCLTDTIKRALDMARYQDYSNKKPLNVVRKVNRILQIASQGSNQERTFPFTKLPTEVRGMIYDLVLTQEYMITIPACSVHEPDADSPKFVETEFYNILLTCKQIYKEALPIYYGTNSFEFLCTGSLLSFLEVCPIDAFENISQINLLWRGPKADSAIGRLSEMKNFTELSIIVDAETTTRPSKHEEEMRKFFHASSRKMIRLVECLGFNELIQLRGLTYVVVRTTPACRKHSRKHQEAADLQGLLNAKLLLPRNSDDLQ